MSESAPVEVSLWTTQTALIFFSPSLRRRASIWSALDAAAPVRRFGQQRVAAGGDQDFGRQAEARRHLLPERREVAGLDHQHGVAGTQGVDQRRLPRAGARRRVDDDRMAGLEDLADVGQDLPAEGAELGPAVVDRRQAHRPQDAVGDRARAGDLEEVAAGRVKVEVEHDRVWWRPHSCTRPRASRSAFVLAEQRRRRRRVQESAEDEAAMLIDRPERLAAGAAAPKGTRLPANEVAVALDRRLSRETEGDVLFDPASRGRYATDASIYQIMPVGVLVPKSDRDVAVALEIARELAVPVLPRGAGTSQCGQTTGAALVIDTTKHLRNVVAVDAERRVATVEPGLVLDHLNAQLKPLGLWFPVDVSTSAQATIGGMAGNNSCGSRSIAYGNMVHNVLGIDTLLADGAAVSFGPMKDGERPRRRDRRLRARPRAQEPRRDRGALAEGAAPRRRLQPRHLPLRRARSPTPATAASTSRTCWSGAEGTLAWTRDADAQARAAAEREGARRRQFPDLPRGDGRRAAHRHARPDRGRAGRPDDDRPGARQPGVRGDDGDGAARRAGGDPARRVRAATSRRRC